MAIRPLMTPEQQTMFKQAVAQGALQPYPYKEYCAITQEKAKKILGWNPVHDSLEEIIESVWNWHKNHPNGYEI